MAVDKDAKLALDWFSKAAQQGNLSAQLQAGEIRYRGEGVSQNHRKSLEYFEQAAKRGSSKARFQLGWMYYKGNGHPVDLVLAHMWFSLSMVVEEDSLAAKRTRSSAKSILRNVEGKMSVEAIMEAQRRATDCFSSGFRDCAN